jgi:hypothetical protein
MKQFMYRSMDPFAEYIHTYIFVKSGVGILTSLNIRTTEIVGMRIFF